eukprot:m.25309 g.25309  ORF g.25309 m.25309 type:complete len:65 (+) comp6182_c0_seq2:132-326(+)
MTSIGCALLLCLRTATAFPTRPIGPTFERDEVLRRSAPVLHSFEIAAQRLSGDGVTDVMVLLFE